MRSRCVGSTDGRCPPLHLLHLLKTQGNHFRNKSVFTARHYSESGSATATCFPVRQEPGLIALGLCGVPSNKTALFFYSLCSICIASKVRCRDYFLSPSSPASAAVLLMGWEPQVKPGSQSCSRAPNQARSPKPCSVTQSHPSARHDGTANDVMKERNVKNHL